MIEENEFRFEGLEEGGFGIVKRDIMRLPASFLHRDAKTLYSYIMMFAGDSSKAWPSTPTILEEIGFSENTFYKYRKQLTDAGIISWEHIKAPWGSRTVYTVHSMPVNRETCELILNERKRRAEEAERKQAELAERKEKYWKKEEQKTVQKERNNKETPASSHTVKFAESAHRKICGVADLKICGQNNNNRNNSLDGLKHEERRPIDPVCRDVSSQEYVPDYHQSSEVLEVCDTLRSDEELLAPVQESLSSQASQKDYGHQGDANYTLPTSADVFERLCLTARNRNNLKTHEARQRTKAAYDKLVKCGCSPELILLAWTDHVRKELDAKRPRRYCQQLLKWFGDDGKDDRERIYRLYDDFQLHNEAITEINFSSVEFF